MNAYPDTTAPTNPATTSTTTARRRTSAMRPMRDGIEVMGPAIRNASAAPRSMPRASKPLRRGIAALLFTYAGRPTAAAIGIEKGLCVPTTASIHATGR